MTGLTYEPAEIWGDQWRLSYQRFHLVHSSCCLCGRCHVTSPGHWLLMCPSLPFSKKPSYWGPWGRDYKLSLLIMQSFSSSPLLLLCLTKTFQTLVMMLQWYTLLHFEWNYQPLFLWRGFCLGPSIPPSQGGLGVRSPAQLALSAFLASAAGSSNLIHHILLPHLQGKFVLCDIM